MPDKANTTFMNIQGSEEPIKGFHLSFGKAIEALKNGESVCREGWNGKGMFLWLNKGSAHGHYDNTAPENVPSDNTIEGIQSRLFELGDVGTVTRLPNINMRAATGSTVTGWLASQTDMLAEDWMIVP